jgi:hypothetical protein
MVLAYVPCIDLMSQTPVDAESREEAHRLGEQLRGLQEEVDRL